MNSVRRSAGLSGPPTSSSNACRNPRKENYLRQRELYPVASCSSDARRPGEYASNILSSPPEHSEGALTPASPGERGWEPGQAYQGGGEAAPPWAAASPAPVIRLTWKRHRSSRD